MMGKSKAAKAVKEANSRQAYVTLCANDGYAPGAVVLASSLRRVGTRRHIVVLITDKVSDKTKYESLLAKFLIRHECATYICTVKNLHTGYEHLKVFRSL